MPGPHLANASARRWLDKGIFLREKSHFEYDRGHRSTDLTAWADLFSPRQLLAHGTFVEDFRRLSRSPKIPYRWSAQMQSSAS